MVERIIVDVEEPFFTPYDALRFFRNIGATFKRGDTLGSMRDDEAGEADFSTGTVQLSYERSPNKQARLTAEGPEDQIRRLADTLERGRYVS